MRASDIPHVAAYLLEKHGLAQRGWRFVWDNARRRAGQCRYFAKTVSLSRYYVDLNVADRLDDVIDTILHEIAHALAGPRHGHDAEWKRQCVLVGAKPQRCYDSSVEMPRGRWAATCGGCGKTYRRHKALRDGYWSFCTKCGREAGRLTYQDTVSVAPTAIPTAPDQPPPPRQLR